MVNSLGAVLARMRSQLAGPDAGAHARSRRQRGPALGIAALIAMAALGGCAEQAGPLSASAGHGRDASWRVAGPVAPVSRASRVSSQTCSGGASGLIDDCGGFARYNGP